MITRLVAALAIIVAGLCTTAMNWRFSYQLGTNVWDSTTWAVFSVALDVAKWLMLPVAALAWNKHKLRALAAVAIWLVATIFSFAAAVGFAALNRDTAVADRAAQVDLRKTIELMRASPRWHSSAACADATAPLSKEFCARYMAAEAKLKAAPQDADPQAALLARITGLPPDTVSLVLALFLAVACEVISALGLFAILPSASKPEAVSKAKAATWKAPTWAARFPRLTPNSAPSPHMTRPGAT